MICNISAKGAKAMMKIAANWQILYDTYDAGEELELFFDK